MSKKEKFEQAVFDAFITQVGDIPKGEVTRPDPPDFRIDAGRHSLAIEITKLFEWTNNRRDKNVQIEMETKRIIECAREMANGKNLPPFVAQISFNKKACLEKKNRRNIANQIVNAIEEYGIGNLGPLVTNVPCNGDYIRSIKVCKPQGATESIWQPVEVAFLKGSCIDDIQHAINKKNPKYADCKLNCHEVWLLIVADFSVPSAYFSISEHTLSHKYDSQYDRVYVCADFKVMFHRLKTISKNQ